MGPSGAAQSCGSLPWLRERVLTSPTLSQGGFTGFSLPEQRF